jgi:hypothetical protein
MERIIAEVRSKLDEQEIGDDEEEKIVEMIEYIREYKVQKKRQKKEVSEEERCGANRSNGDQCTRKKKKGSEYCGTHEKGTPHGKVVREEVEKKVQKIPIWTLEIRGIVYYVDIDKNVYCTEDIMENKVNPRVLTKYEVNEKGEYMLFL